MMYEPVHQDEFITDPYANSQFEQTQQASQSQDVEVWDERLWGVLKPLHHSHSRILLYKDKSSLTIGRGSENNHKVANLKVSNKHCILTWDATSGDSSVKVRDTSSNGTWINGRKIGRGQTALLQDGNVFALGQWSEINSPDNYRYIFRYTADGPLKDGVYKYYDIGHEIGRGSFATVLRGVCREDGQTYAIKMVKRQRLRVDGAGAASVFMKEIQILEKLHHPNICRLKEAFHEEESVVLILEYIDGGDLLDYILSRDGLTEEESRRLAFQLCKALKYIHAKGIAHRDLKPENILLTRDNPPVLKIADFGLAKAVDSCTRYKTTCGTPIYLAPEVILRNAQDSYSHVVDSWSTGVIIFAMIANATPFADDDASVMAIRFRSRYIDWSLLESKGISSECRKFLEGMLEENPVERMSCSDALRDAWLAPLAAHDPEALDDAANDSFMSVQANAGSFLDAQPPTPQPPPPATLPDVSRPSSQELQSAGISRNFERIRMDEASAVSEPEPTPESRPAETSANRGHGRKLERHAMQIAEYDEDGNLKSFSAFPLSPIDPGPIYVDDVNGDGHDVQRDNGSSSQNDQGAGPADAAENVRNGVGRDEGDDKPEPALTPAAENGNAVVENGQIRTTNMRKRSAPVAHEPQDADPREEAPSKRSRALPADVAT